MSRAVELFCLAVLILLPSVCVARQQKQEKQIAELIENLGDEDFDAREKARQSLEKIGEPAWGALVRAKEKHKDPEVRRQARKALAAILDARLTRLITDLGDKQKPKRDAAAKDLAKMLAATDETAQQQATKAALVQAMKRHKDAAVKKGAADVLSQAYAPQVKKLIEQLADDSFQNRVNAERDLLLVGVPALGALKEATKSPDLEKAYRARQLVKRIEGK